MNPKWVIVRGIVVRGHYGDSIEIAINPHEISLSQKAGYHRVHRTSAGVAHT